MFEVFAKQKKMRPDDTKLLVVSIHLKNIGQIMVNGKMFETTTKKTFPEKLITKWEKKQRLSNNKHYRQVS